MMMLPDGVRVTPDETPVFAAVGKDIMSPYPEVCYSGFF
jgi:hypothetical protein